MSSKEEKASLFKLIGLSDQKIDETIKNEALTKLLVEIITHVDLQTHFQFYFLMPLFINIL
jgi:hypothetical protein